MEDPIDHKAMESYRRRDRDFVLCIVFIVLFSVMVLKTCSFGWGERIQAPSDPSENSAEESIPPEYESSSQDGDLE